MELICRGRRLEEVERWERIRDSRYNRWYGMVKGVGVPGYMKRGWGESRWIRVATFRLGNEMRGGRYWEEEEEEEERRRRRRRRIGNAECMVGGRRRGSTCGRCVRGWGWRWGWQEVVRDVLSDEGGGEDWMRRVEERRGGGVEECKHKD